MIDETSMEESSRRLLEGGLPEARCIAFMAAVKDSEGRRAGNALYEDATAVAAARADSLALLSLLPVRSQRTVGQKLAGEALVHSAAKACTRR